MSTVQEIERAFLELTVAEKRELLKLLSTQMEKAAAAETPANSGGSNDFGLGRPGVNVGQMIRQFERADLMDEMLGAK